MEPQTEIASSGYSPELHQITAAILSSLHLRVDDSTVLSLAVDVVHLGHKAGLGHSRVEDVIKIDRNLQKTRPSCQRSRRRLSSFCKTHNGQETLLSSSSDSVGRVGSVGPGVGYREGGVNTSARARPSLPRRG